MSRLVLSVFPGIGLLDHGFEYLDDAPFKGELKHFKYTRRRVFIVLDVDRADGELEAGQGWQAFTSRRKAERAAAEGTVEHGGEAVGFELVPVARISRPSGWRRVDGDG